MKIAVYTVILKDYDTIKPINPLFYSDADYFLFTEHTKAIEPYIIRQIPYHTNTLEESRKYKILAHEYFPEYDYSIYLDGAMQLLESPKILIDKYLQNHNIAVFKHPERKSIYEEAELCLAIGRGVPETIEEQVSFLRSENYPEDNGLTANGVLIRRHSLDIVKLNYLWWNIFNRFPTRDQLSFCYCTWKLGIEYRLINEAIEGTVNKTSEFELHPHNEIYEEQSE